MNVIATFAHKKYTEHGASILSLEWANKHQYFYDVWSAQEDPMYVYTQKDLDEYVQTEDYCDFYLGLEGEGPVMDRASTLFWLVPGAPREYVVAKKPKK